MSATTSSNGGPLINKSSAQSKVRRWQSRCSGRRLRRSLLHRCRHSFPFPIAIAPSACSPRMSCHSERSQEPAFCSGFRRVLLLSWAVFLLFCAPVSCLLAQTAPAPGPKPPDAPVEWKRFIGVYKYSSYGYDEKNVIILERDQRAYMQRSSGNEDEIQFDMKLKVMFVPDSAKGSRGYGMVEDDPDAPVPYFTYLNESYKRTDPGASTHQFPNTSTRAVEELRTEALAATPPTEPGPFRNSDLVELAKLAPAIHLDIRYATSNDFLGTPVYTQARAFLQRPGAEALLRALHKLQPLGYGLLIHDAYRPWYVTKIFWEATPPDGKIFVADPAQGSRHNRGCAVDLTLYDLKSGAPVEMTGLYDEMSPRSFPNYPGGTSLQRWHRDLLRWAMESEGFTVYESEWWHFDYKDWHQYAIGNTPFEKLNISPN
jgi:D-alanyl-D-alanine dipeptidase